MACPRFAALLTVAALLAPAAPAQSLRIVKGTRDALKGMTKAYVDTKYNPEFRDLVIAQLNQQLPELSIVDEPTDDALVIQFSRSYSRNRLEPRPPDSTSAAVPGVSTQERTRAQSGGSMRATRGRMRRITGGSPATLSIPGIEDGAAVVPAPSDMYIPPAPKPTPHIFGTVLKPTGENSFVEAVKFWRGGSYKGTERAVRDFVAKIAKEYRKANASK
jgi:hypothetical protein